MKKKIHTLTEEQMELQLFEENAENLVLKNQIRLLREEIASLRDNLSLLLNDESGDLEFVKYKIRKNLKND